MFYVYVVRDNVKNQLYIGYTNNLERRLKEHRKQKRPELIYYEAYKSEKDARNREQKLKQRGQSIRWLKQRILHSTKE